jgi:hypothetical protein
MQEAGTGALELLKFPWQLSPGHPSSRAAGSSACACPRPGRLRGVTRVRGALPETPTAHSPPGLGPPTEPAGATPATPHGKLGFLGTVGAGHPVDVTSWVWRRLGCRGCGPRWISPPTCGGSWRDSAPLVRVWVVWGVGGVRVSVGLGSLDGERLVLVTVDFGCGAFKGTVDS